jgi:hypothetical protein
MKARTASGTSSYSAQFVRDIDRHITRPSVVGSVEGDDAGRMFILPVE